MALSHRFILTVSCPDKFGIVHQVSGLLFGHLANIEEAAQFHDTDSGLFFMRVQFSCDPLIYPELREATQRLAADEGMDARLYDATKPVPTIIFVSQQGHCLNDLLFRWKSGLLPIDIRAVVSNHTTFEEMTRNYGVPFHYLPMASGSKAEIERRQLDIVSQSGAELVVLARYMQILSDEMCRELSGRAINIHHSFLPSFKGAKPYYQAHDRGVKLIGATAHYVTADLDEGPIIEQDVARVDHSLSIDDLTALGRDTESQVLARAVKWYAEHRVLLDRHRTVIFR